MNGGLVGDFSCWDCGQRECQGILYGFLLERKRKFSAHLEAMVCRMEKVPESVFTLTSFQNRFFNPLAGFTWLSRTWRSNSACRCRRIIFSSLAETGAAGGGPVAVVGSGTALLGEETWRA